MDKVTPIRPRAKAVKRETIQTNGVTPEMVRDTLHRLQANLLRLQSCAVMRPDLFNAYDEAIIAMLAGSIAKAQQDVACYRARKGGGDAS